METLRLKIETFSLKSFFTVCFFYIASRYRLKSKEALKRRICPPLASPSDDLYYVIHNYPKALYNYTRHFLDCV